MESNESNPLRDFDSIGTAMTGTLTRPPITEGNAPSIPAAQIITRAACNNSRLLSSR